MNSGRRSGASCGVVGGSTSHPLVSATSRGNVSRRNVSRRNVSRRNVSLLALIATLALGCRTTAEMRSDLVSETGVGVLEVRSAFKSESEGAVTIVLEIESPRREAARVEALTYELWLSGRRFASATERLNLPLRPGLVERFDVTLPLVFRPQEIRRGPQGIAVEVRGTIDVREEGRRANRRSFLWRGGVVSDGAPVFDRDRFED